MKIAFTICSNNYYAQALTLAKSCNFYNPDVLFIIGLVDEPCTIIDYCQDFEHIFFSQLPINTTDLISKYDIIELNTSVKPSLFLNIIARYPKVKDIHYFDPDIKLFSSFNELEKEFDGKSILLTPHIFTPISNTEGSPQDHLFLNYGIFNLGYLGLKINNSTISLLKWWESKTLSLGFNRVCEGLFVDQLWINHVPIFYNEETKISFHPGLNAAPWNLHERKLSLQDEVYIINNKKLVFFHFSNYKYQNSNKIANFYRYTFEEFPELIHLYDEYHQDLLANKIEIYSKIPCAYYNINKRKIELEVSKEKNKNASKLKYMIRKIIPPIVTDFIVKLK